MFLTTYNKVKDFLVKNKVTLAASVLILGGASVVLGTDLVLFIAAAMGVVYLSGKLDG